MEQLIFFNSGKYRGDFCMSKELSIPRTGGEFIFAMVSKLFEPTSFCR
jgi:hypothetical protein